MTSRALGLALLLMLATAPLSAQAGAFYPGRDLPAPWTEPLANYGDSGGGDFSGDPIDATALTAAPELLVADRDGDGHLDGLRLHGGIWSWMGNGDGSFGTGSFREHTVPSTSPLDGRLADLNLDGRLDVLFIGQTFGPVMSVGEIFLGRLDGNFQPASANFTPLPTNFAVHE